MIVDITVRMSFDVRGVPKHFANTAKLIRLIDPERVGEAIGAKEYMGGTAQASIINCDQKLLKQYQKLLASAQRLARSGKFAGFVSAGIGSSLVAYPINSTEAKKVPKEFEGHRVRIMSSYLSKGTNNV